MRDVTSLRTSCHVCRCRELEKSGHQKEAWERLKLPEPWSQVHMWTKLFGAGREIYPVKDRHLTQQRLKRTVQTARTAICGKAPNKTHGRNAEGALWMLTVNVSIRTGHQLDAGIGLLPLLLHRQCFFFGSISGASRSRAAKPLAEGHSFGQYEN